MTHPDEHLAPYVDGTLVPTERAGSTQHLRSCGVSGEVDAAGAPAPPSAALPAPVSPDSRRGSRPRTGTIAAPRASSKPRRGRSSRRWLAAAAVVAVVAARAPRLGAGPDDARLAADGVADGR